MVQTEGHSKNESLWETRSLYGIRSSMFCFCRDPAGVFFMGFFVLLGGEEHETYC